MGLGLEYISGQTPLSEEEKEGLQIRSVTTRGELDELEHLNIEKAVQWSVKNTFPKEKILTEAFIKSVHRKMFGDVWSWAGEFRKTDKNIGVPWYRVAVDLKTLLDDALFWVENKTFIPDEIAVRFKHRIVSIHCFPNGNGRHSRLMADMIISSVFEKEVFTWGSTSQLQRGLIRKEYIECLKHADNGVLTPLIEFARK